MRVAILLVKLSLFWKLAQGVFEPPSISTAVQIPGEDHTFTIYRQLYNGHSIQDFLDLCPLNEPETLRKGASPKEEKAHGIAVLSFQHCLDWNEYERKCLDEAKDRTKELLQTVGHYYTLALQLILFAYIIAIGIVLYVKGHFSFRVYYDSHYRDKTHGYHFDVYTKHMKWHAWEIRKKVVLNEEADAENSSSAEYDAYKHGFPYVKPKKKKKYAVYPRTNIKKRKLIDFDHGLERL